MCNSHFTSLNGLLHWHWFFYLRRPVAPEQRFKPSTPQSGLRCFRRLATVSVLLSILLLLLSFRLEAVGTEHAVDISLCGHHVEADAKRRLCPSSVSGLSEWRGTPHLYVWLYVQVCGKRLHTLQSHPALSEPMGSPRNANKITNFFCSDAESL